MSTRNLVLLIHGLISLAIIAGTTVLLALHDVQEATALALYGVAVTLAGGTANTLLALKVPTENG